MKYRIIDTFTAEELAILRHAIRYYSELIDRILKEDDRLKQYGRQYLTDQLLAKLSNAKVLNDDEE